MYVTPTTRRAALLAGTVTALSASPVLAAIKPRASTPVSPVQDDVAYLQFGALAELLCIHVYRAAAGHDGFSARQRDWLLAARAADKQHYARLAAPLGSDAPQFGDYQVVFDAKTLSSRTRLLERCDELERLATGVYIYGAANASDPGTRELLARLVASDNQHIALVRRLDGRSPLMGAVPAPVALEVAGPKLDTFINDLYPKA